MCGWASDHHSRSFVVASYASHEKTDQTLRKLRRGRDPQHFFCTRFPMLDRIARRHFEASWQASYASMSRKSYSFDGALPFGTIRWIEFASAHLSLVFQMHLPSVTEDHQTLLKPCKTITRYVAQKSSVSWWFARRLHSVMDVNAHSVGRIVYTAILNVFDGCQNACAGPFSRIPQNVSGLNFALRVDQRVGQTK